MPTKKTRKQISASDTRTLGTIRSAAKISRVGRPTKHQSEEIGSRILDVSAELFAAQGFAATSMEQIASACGAGKDTLYRRYPTKANLFASLMERMHESLIPELDHAMESSKEPLAKLRHYARLILSINLRWEFLALNRVALGEAMALGGVKPIPVRDDPVMMRLSKLVVEATAAGHLIGGDDYFIAEQLLYMTSIKPLISAMIGDCRYSEAHVQDEYFEKAWVLFLSGATPRPGESLRDANDGSAKGGGANTEI